MFYVYILGFDRSLRRADAPPCLLRSEADELASRMSLDPPRRNYLAMTVDSRCDLHNTRDGKPILEVA